MNYKTRFRSTPFSLATLLLASGLVYGQGISGITVQTIKVSPVEFRGGQALTISIDVKAPSSGSTTGGVRAYVNMFKGDQNGHLTWLATDWLDGVSWSGPALAPNAIEHISFSKTMTVPSDPTNQIPVIYLVAGAFDPPAEFAQEKIVAFDFSCPGDPTNVCRYFLRKIRITKWVGGKK